jgi:hypothetical protein
MCATTSGFLRFCMQVCVHVPDAPSGIQENFTPTFSGGLSGQGTKVSHRGLRVAGFCLLALGP